MTAPAVRHADAEDRPAVERLWQLFRHDLSEFRGDLPEGDGSFGNGWVELAFTEVEDRVPYVVTGDGRPVGFVFVRALTQPVRVMNAFFVVRGARRAGVGVRAAAQVLALHPGRWGIPFQDANAGAARFWRRVASEVAGSAWEEERRPVPGRPEVPPDVWITLDVPPPTAE